MSGDGRRRMGQEREFYPEDDQPDSDAFTPSSGAVGRAAGDAARKRPAQRRETIYMSRTVYRDGAAMTLDEVLWTTEDEEEVPEKYLTPGTYEAPDRAKRPWEWWLFWRPYIQNVGASGRWRGTTRPEPIEWFCKWCGEPMEVKSKGRPPEYHEKCQKPAWRARQLRVKVVSGNAPSK